jgi:cytochrome c oxidase cbb3-type subunit III
VCRARAVALRVVGMLMAMVVTVATGQDSREAVNRETAKPEIRGGIVFKSYCGLCHGEHGDGKARAAKLYGELKLTIKHRPPEYYETIIRQGGPAVGGSAFMPPWQYELSEEQIGDVIAYIAIVGDPVRRGEVVYKTNCILCHGVQADGKGRAAPLFHPPPADLTHSEKDDQYKTTLIRLGSTAMGRSSGMPPWQDRLSDGEIADVVEYLRTILVASPAR